MEDGKPKKKSKAGQPRKFATEQEFIEAFNEFLFDVVQGGFTISPSHLRFCMWYSEKYGNIDRKTVYNLTYKYFPNIKKVIQELRAEILSEGAATGSYNPTMAIFMLKNWCGWKDKWDDDTEKKDVPIQKIEIEVLQGVKIEDNTDTTSV